jgi:F-type H+-transporting ATPase subunit b
MWLAPSLSWATEAQGVETESPFALLMRVINFVVLAAVLVYFLRRPISSLIRRRQESVREALDGAERAQREAEARYREMEAKLAQAQREMEELREAIIEQGRVEKERIIQSAKAEAEKIRKQAEAQMEFEFNRAKQQLRREAVELATQVAENLLSQRIKTEDHQRIFHEYLQMLGKRAR